MRTANLAIVFTDIQGFTERTSRQTLDQNQRLLKAHSDLLRPLFGAFGGRVIKSIGDAFLVTFESPTQAVLCGAAIQDRLWHYNRTAPEAERLDVRVAINAGEVRLESNDVFGEPVNIAARVEQLAQAGDVYFTEAVYLAMNKAEVPAQEVGAFDLKGIPGKIRIFKVPHAPYRVAPAQGAELASEQPPYGNLGLARVEDVLRTEKYVANLGAHAAALGAQAAALGAKAQEALAATRRRVPRPWLLGGGAVLGLVALVMLVSLLSGSELDRALVALEEAPAEARAPHVAKVQTLIAGLEDPGEAAYYEGRLDEALGGVARSTRAYRRAVEAGSGRAERRLIDLLEHPECRARQAAAETLGALKSTRARGALEDLAERGGAGEDDLPLFGCNSRRAAQQALQALNE